MVGLHINIPAPKVRTPRNPYRYAPSATLNTAEMKGLEAALDWAALKLVNSNLPIKQARYEVRLCVLQRFEVRGLHHIPSSRYVEVIDFLIGHISRPTLKIDGGYYEA